MSETTPFLEVRDLCKRYTMGAATLDVLKGVNLHVARGEVVGIVGASGAGKSTLLHLLGGLDAASSGSVRMEGTELSQLSNTRRAWLRSHRIGFVFQAYYLLNEMDALENVTLAARFGGHNTKIAIARATQVLSSVGLQERLRHRPAQMSGGEQQRVAIARALVNDPDLLLADEPTGNLDSKTGDGIIQLLLDLQTQRKMTLMIITHDPNIARRAQRVLEIADGKIINETRGTQ